MLGLLFESACLGRMKLKEQGPSGAQLGRGLLQEQAVQSCAIAAGHKRFRRLVVAYLRLEAWEFGVWDVWQVRHDEVNRPGKGRKEIATQER